MGMAGLWTRKTCAPDSCVQWTMGMPAKAELETNRPIALVSIALVALFLIANMMYL
jgi:hypothetical protein